MPQDTYWLTVLRTETRSAKIKVKASDIITAKSEALVLAKEEDFPWSDSPVTLTEYDWEDE